MKKVAGLFVSAALLIVLFVPLFSIPILGSFNAIKLQEQGNSLLIEIVICSFLAFIIAITGNYRGFIFIGIIVAGDVTYNLYRIGTGIAGNELTKSLLQYEWGWGYWALVAIAFFIIGFSKDEKTERIKALKICLFCAEDIKIDASICRYCGKEQPIIEKVIPESELIIEDAPEDEEEARILTFEGKIALENYREKKKLLSNE